MTAVTSPPDGRRILLLTHESLEREGGTRLPRLAKNSESPRPFDPICRMAFDKKPLTRRERAANVVKREVFNKYGPQARAVLDALLRSMQMKDC
jgi:type I restriction enzyme R subunit